MPPNRHNPMYRERVPAPMTLTLAMGYPIESFIWSGLVTSWATADCRLPSNSPHWSSNSTLKLFCHQFSRDIQAFGDRFFGYHISFLKIECDNWVNRNNGICHLTLLIFVWTCVLFLFFNFRPFQPMYWLIWDKHCMRKSPEASTVFDFNLKRT